VFLGLGYTFYTGAEDAWLVDALKASGYNEPLERVFSRGQMLFGAAMLVGDDRRGRWADPPRHPVPWCCGPPSSCASSYWRGSACRSSASLHGRWNSAGPAELRRVFVEGLSYGLRNPVIRP